MLSPSLTLLTQVWRDALGDIQAPEYTHYIEKADKMRELNNNHKYFGQNSTVVMVIVGLIWFFWFANSVFNMVIMLNFMIAIISASYERVMNRKDQFMY